MAAPAPAPAAVQDAASLGKREKAAILILSMGAEAAGQIFRGLREEEVEELTALITKVSAIPENVRKEVLTDFISQLRNGDAGGASGAFAVRNLLSKALGDEKAAALLEHAETPDGRSEHFDFLNHMDARLIANVLRMEQPQTVALVMSHLKAPRAAEILQVLPAEMQNQVVERIATMERISPTVVKKVEEILQRQFSQNARDRMRPTGGIKVVAELLNYSGKESEKQIFEAIQARNPTLVDEVKRLMLVFEDLAKLPDSSAQLILREVDMGAMALALKSASEGMKSLIFKNLSQRAAERLKEEIELMGPKPRAEVKQAQEQIVAVARKLEEEGKINLGRGGKASDDLV